MTDLLKRIDEADNPLGLLPEWIAAIESLRQALEKSPDCQDLYYDLLMQVHSAFPGETRHETAKRYIMNAENLRGVPCEASQNRNELASEKD